MILLDEDQNGKLSSFNSGTVRIPERVIGRSSLLPDYETSQAQHITPSSASSSTVTFRKYSLHSTVDSRFWRATLYALAIYIALSVTIGVPLIVTKLAHRHRSGPPPGPWSKGDNDATSLSSPLMMVNSGLFSMSSIHCNMWNTSTKENGLWYSSSSHALAPSGSFSIRSSDWLMDSEDMPPEISGNLSVLMNPDSSATSALFYVTMVSSSAHLRDSCKICYSDDDDNRGLSLYIPANLSDSESLSFNITLLFPQSSTTVQLENLVTYLPAFTQSFGSLSPQVMFDKLDIEGAGKGINCDSVWANQINIKNLLAPISGTFNATNSLKLDTVKGPITANLTLVQDYVRTAPTFFALDTGESEIQANIVMLAPTSPSTTAYPINFIGHVKNFDGPITLNVSHHESTAPVPLDLRVQNNQAASNISLDSKFSGTYDITTKLAAATIQMESDLDDYVGTGQRVLQKDVDLQNKKCGWVGWGRKPSHFDPRLQGQVMLVSSLSPISLSLGS